MFVLLLSFVCIGVCYVWRVYAWRVCIVCVCASIARHVGLLSAGFPLWRGVWREECGPYDPPIPFPPPPSVLVWRLPISLTPRRFSAFPCVPQVAFADLKDDMDLAEDFLKYLVAYALAHCQASIEHQPIYEYTQRHPSNHVTNQQKSQPITSEIFLFLVSTQRMVFYKYGSITPNLHT